MPHRGDAGSYQMPKTNKLFNFKLLIYNPPQWDDPQPCFSFHPAVTVLSWPSTFFSSWTSTMAASGYISQLHKNSSHYGKKFYCYVILDFLYLSISGNLLASHLQELKESSPPFRQVASMVDVGGRAYKSSTILHTQPWTVSETSCTHRFLWETKESRIPISTPLRWCKGWSWRAYSQCARLLGRL